LETHTGSLGAFEKLVRMKRGRGYLYERATDDSLGKVADVWWFLLNGPKVASYV
jgi:hypothetical protein